VTPAGTHPRRQWRSTGAVHPTDAERKSSYVLAAQAVVASADGLKLVRADKVEAGDSPSRAGTPFRRRCIPSILGKLLHDEDPARAGRVMQAMLGMKKIDIEGLKRACEQA
jgi:hypothetical protein